MIVHISPGPLLLDPTLYNIHTTHTCHVLSFVCYGHHPRSKDISLAVLQLTLRRDRGNSHASLLFKSQIAMLSDIQGLPLPNLPLFQTVALSCGFHVFYY
jgi:hypothetical protein